MTGDGPVTAPRPVLLLVAGFVAWSSAFVLLYAGLSMGCALGWDRVTLGPISLLRLGLLLLWSGHLVVLACLIIASRRRAAAERAGPAAFILKAAVAGSVAAFVATVWTGMVIPAATMCI